MSPANVSEGEIARAIATYANVLQKLESDNEAAIAAPPSTNPKDAIGRAKVSLSVVPSTALLHLAMAMMDGANKYGAHNWRQSSVAAKVYVDAAFRHLLAWFEGEEVAEDSGVSHLGHCMACLAILIDAKEQGMLADDRPKSAGRFSVLLKQLNQQIKEKQQGGK